MKENVLIEQLKKDPKYEHISWDFIKNIEEDGECYKFEYIKMIRKVLCGYTEWYKEGKRHRLNGPAI